MKMLHEFGGSYGAGPRQEPPPPVQAPPREEMLYVCEEYKLFILTGQRQGADERRIYPAAKPFHLLEEDACRRLREVAQPWAEGGDILISPYFEKPGLLELYDRVAGTSLKVPFDELSPEVQAKLGCNNPDPFAKYAVDPIRTAHDIPVGRPLTLKKAGP